MDLQQYVGLATRTESLITSVQTDEYTLKKTLEAFILASNLLDMIKKNVFYNKPIDPIKWQQTVVNLSDISGDIPWDVPTPQDGTLNLDTRLFHGVIGILTESGELANALWLSLDRQKPIDGINCLEELGDLCWYQAIVIDCTGANWNNILVKNIEKLQKRYPAKFTSVDAIERDLDGERAILETMEIR